MALFGPHVMSELGSGMRPKSDVRRLVQVCPTRLGKNGFLPSLVGQITPERKNLSSPRAKKISLFPKPKSVVCSQPSRPDQRGVSRSSRTLGRDAVDAIAAADD